MSPKVALVTGGNRGIGFEICKLICKKFKETSGTVILTARDEDSGQKACSKLVADGCNAKFIQLDVTSKESIVDAAEKIRVDYEGLDVLINNAGIMYSSSKCKDTPYTSQVEATLKTNFYGVLNVCEIMYPLLNENARVVNVTSRLGNMKLYAEDWKAKGVLINSCCPGWCRSSLGGQNAPRSAEEGAADIVDVTMKQSNGSYWEDGKENFDILP